MTLRETAPAPKRNSAPRKIVVTGGLGFVGAEVFRYLKTRAPGAEIVILDAFTAAADVRRLAGLAAVADLPVIRGDVRSHRDVAAALHGCDTLVHLAADAVPAARTSRDQRRSYEVRVAGTETLLEAAGEAGVRHVVHVSPATVYGTTTALVDEDTPLCPRDALALAAAHAEETVMLAAHYGLRASILRSTEAFGAGQGAGAYLPALLIQALKGRPLPVHGGGLRVRAPIPVSDLARAIALVADSTDPAPLAIFNVAGDERLSERDMALRVAAATGSAAGLAIARGPHPAAVAPLLDTRRVKALGYRQESSFDRELAALVDSVQTRARAIRAPL